MVRFVWLAMLLMLPFSAECEPLRLRVAAASNLRFVMPDLIRAFKEHAPDVQVIPVYGSSARLYRQILHGAPFDVFFSADTDMPQRLHRAGKGVGRPRPYALGRLVLWSRNRPKVTGLEALARLPERVVLANPQHAPYGLRAQQALQRAGVWSDVEGRLVFADNIVQAAQYAQNGAAAFGILALSLTKAPEFPAGHASIIDQQLYDPLVQSALILPGKHEDIAQRFLSLCLSPEGQSVLKAFGYGSPLEAP